MQVFHMNEGGKIDYQLKDSMLKISDIEINLQERQQDIETTINISKNGEEIIEGIGYWLVATILLPPKKYNIIETIYEDEIKTEIQALPLNIEEVKLYLFSME